VTRRHAVFSHGQESGPWGKKITALAEVARAQGYEAWSVDYRGIHDPRDRAARLIDYCKELPGYRVLIGSSVGGHVSVAAASCVPVRGMFLIAPALYLKPLPPLPEGRLDCPATLVHGFNDEVVPFEDSIRFARAQRAALHLLDGDHVLHQQLQLIQRLFESFLAGLDLPALAGSPS
jgi:pimeloyl-ACP methyl ester carboxylesterase